VAGLPRLKRLFLRRCAGIPKNQIARLAQHPGLRVIHDASPP